MDVSEEDVEDGPSALPVSAVEIAGEERCTRDAREASSGIEALADGAPSSGEEGRAPRAPADIVVVFTGLRW